ncbi:MAG: O-antigen ligase family protein [Candidatus Hydrothermales bacterium]
MKAFAQLISIIVPISFPLSVTLSSILFIILIIFPILKFKDFAIFSKKFKLFYLLFFLFLLSYTLSAILSCDTVDAIKRAREYFFYLGIISVAFIFREKIDLEKILKIFLFFSAISVLYSILSILRGTANEGRAHGFFLHPLTYAGFLIIPTLFSVGLFFIKKKSTQKIILLLISLILFLGLILTDSRGAIVVTFLSLLILIYKFSKKLILPLIVVALFFSALFIIKNPLNLREKALREQSLKKRLELIRAFPEFFLKRALFGYGRVHTQKIVSHLEKENFNREKLDLLRYMNHFHVSYLQVLFYFGISGFLLLYSLFFYLLYILYKKSRESIFSFLNLVNLFAFLTYGLFEINIFADEILLPLFFFIGISLVENENNSIFRV